MARGRFDCSSVLWGNFVVSVWLLIVKGTIEFAIYLPEAAEFYREWGPFTARVMGAPFVIAVTNLILWFGVYRNDRQGARVLGGCVGIFLFLGIVVVNLINANLNDRWQLSRIQLAVYIYVILSHWAFSLFYGKAPTMPNGTSV